MADFYHSISVLNWGDCDSASDDWCLSDDTICQELLNNIDKDFSDIDQNREPPFTPPRQCAAQKRKWDFDTPQENMAVNPCYLLHLTHHKLNQPMPPPGQRRFEPPIRRHTLLKNLFKVLTTREDDIMLNLHSPPKRSAIGEILQAQQFVYPPNSYPSIPDNLHEHTDENLNLIEQNIELAEHNLKTQHDKITPTHDQCQANVDNKQSINMKTEIGNTNEHRTCDLLLANIDSESSSDSDSDGDTVERAELDCMLSCDYHIEQQNFSNPFNVSNNSCSFDQRASGNPDEIETLIRHITVDCV